MAVKKTPELVGFLEEFFSRKNALTLKKTLENVEKMWLFDVYEYF